MSKKQAITDSAKVREELLGSMRIEAWDDDNATSLVFLGICLDERVDQLIDYANAMLLQNGKWTQDSVSLQESLAQNLCFSVPGIDGATGICIDVAHIHYFNLGLIDAADFVIMQANM